MAQVKAKLSFLRISPRKVRLVSDLLKKKKVDQAKSILSFTVKKGAEPILKVLNSAVSNAKNNFQMDPSNLYVSKITVDEGPKYKRWMPRARGSAYPIQKKTSHVSIWLDEIVSGKKTEKSEEPKRQASSKPASQKPKFRPESEKQTPRSKAKGLSKIFRRKTV